MSNIYEEAGVLLGLIPSFLCRPEQVAWWGQENSQTYKLLRDPISLRELCKYDHFAIWRESGTLTYVSPKGHDDFPEFPGRIIQPSGLVLDFAEMGLTLFIFGSTNDAIGETVDYFLSLEEQTEKAPRLEVRAYSDYFDFREAQSHCFERLFEADTSRRVIFKDIMLTAELSIFLATRPHPVRVTFVYCVFEDEGTAFVNALENRQFSFGSLSLRKDTGFSDDNLTRLLQTDTLDHLGLPFFGNNDELALLALSAKVDSLHCCIFTSTLGFDVQSLNILASKISLTLAHDEYDVFPTELLLPFFRRLADLGHFMDVKVRFNSPFRNDTLRIVPDSIVEELIRVARANCEMKELDFSTTYKDLTWDPHVTTLFKGLSDHKALRTLKLTVANSAFGPNFSHLRKFLSRHRNVTVTDYHGNIYSDGKLVDALYFFNRFCRDSASLLMKPPSNRPSLLATALAESASSDFQRSGLLLAYHTDALCELVQFSPLADEIDKDDALSQSYQEFNELVECADLKEPGNERDSSSQSNQARKRQRV